MEVPQDEIMSKDESSQKGETPEPIKRTFSTDFGGKANFQRNPSRITVQTPTMGGTTTCGLCCVSSTPCTGDEWDVPESLFPIHVCNTASYNFTRSRFLHQKSRISILAICGGVNLVIPDEIRMHRDGYNVCGDFSDKRSSNKVEKDENTPSLSISEIALCGRVGVYSPDQYVMGGCCCCYCCGCCCC